MIHTAKTIQEWDCSTQKLCGTWVPARSLNHEFDAMWSRIKWAWGVLIGRYDALDWEEKK